MDEDKKSPQSAEKPLQFSSEQPKPVHSGKKAISNEDAVSHAKFKEPRGSKWMYFLIFIFVIGLIGGAPWYFFVREAPSNGSEGQATDNSLLDDDGVVIPAPSYTIDKIVYGFGVSFASSADIYTRPAQGGDRQSIFDLKTVGAIGVRSMGDQDAFVQSRKLAFVVDNTQIYVSDGESKPELAFEEATDGDPERGLGITSSVISPDGTMIAFTYVPDGIASPMVRIVSVSSGEARTIVESATLAPLQWSHDNEKLVFGQNILGAGAQLQTPYILEIESGKETPIAEGKHPYTFPVYAFSSDATKVAYISPTIDEGRTTDDIIGFYVGKPYKAFWKDLKTGEVKEVKSFSSNTMPRSVIWQHGTDSLIIAHETKLFAHDITTGKTTNIYDTTTTDIDVLYAADEDSLLMGSLRADQTYSVYFLDIEKKSREEVMQTTDSTTPVGILIK